MSTDIKLLPCPVNKNCRPSVQFNNKDQMHYGWCEDHDWTGPYGVTPEEAAEAWNTRPTVSREQQPSPSHAKRAEVCVKEMGHLVYRRSAGCNMNFAELRLILDKHFPDHSAKLRKVREALEMFPSGHTRGCSYDTSMSSGPEGDFCTCGRSKRLDARKEALTILDNLIAKPTEKES